MKPSSKISLLIAAVLAVLASGLIYLLGLIAIHHLLLVMFLMLLMSYLVIYVLLEHLFFRDVKEMTDLFDALNSGIGLEEIDINRGKTRLPVVKKLYKSLYRHVLAKQYRIEEMERIAAFRKEFIADVSHELKTPIFAAQGFVHTLLDGAVEDENVRMRFLQKAAMSLDGLDSLVQDLLVLSNIETGETKMRFEYFDLKGLAEEVIDQFESKRENRTLELLANNEEIKSMIVYADWLRIKQALINLVSNAVKYSAEDGHVQLILAENHLSIEIMVKDDGAGIPEVDIERIFERFYRVDKSRSREKGGTGLGLAIVKHIIEGHHGKVKVNSEEGIGSSFSFQLPKGKDK
jgi:two-component system phosphate regulon sensor histidine kinase PhoR